MTRESALKMAEAKNKQYWDDADKSRKQFKAREPVDQHGSMPDYIADLILQVERETAKRCAEIASPHGTAPRLFVSGLEAAASAIRREFKLEGR